MLIISQDRKRMSENLEISIMPVYEDDLDNISEEIVGWKIINNYAELGVYETEERAKEVIKDIINFYTYGYQTDDLVNEESVLGILKTDEVFYMPQKEDL